MREESRWLRQVMEAETNEKAMALLEQGAQAIGRELNELANRHREGMPLLLACVKGCLPHWERYAGEAGNAFCRTVMEHMMTVDASALMHDEGE